MQLIPNSAGIKRHQALRHVTLQAPEKKEFVAESKLHQNIQGYFAIINISCGNMDH